jgi:hypothetical protein
MSARDEASKACIAEAITYTVEIAHTTNGDMQVVVKGWLYHNRENILKVAADLRRAADLLELRDAK